MLYLWTLLAWLLLLGLHELGHVLAAYALGLKVYGVRLGKGPVPHVFVETAYTGNRRKRAIFYMAGPAMSCLLFAGLLLTPLRDAFLIYAFVLTLIIESNPFFSDFTMLLIGNKMQHTSERNPERVWNDFLFGKIWYLWFLAWSAYIFLLLRWAQGRVG